MTCGIDDMGDVMARADRWRGLVYGLVVVVLFGLYTPVAKHWLAAVAPILCTGLLYLSAGVALTVLRAMRRLAGHEIAPTRRLRKADAPILALGVSCGSLASPLLLVGLEHVSGTVGALLGNLEGVFTVGIALLLGDSLGQLEVAGASAILAGGMVLSLGFSGGPANEAAGVVAIAAACLAWALDNTTTQRLSERDPLTLMGTKCLLAGTLALALGSLLHEPTPGGAGILAAVLIGAFGWAGSMVCFAVAMRHLGAAKVGSLLALAPFVGAMGSILGLGEGLTAAILAAGALMALGAALLARGHLAASAML